MSIFSLAKGEKWTRSVRNANVWEGSLNSYVSFFFVAFQSPSTPQRQLFSCFSFFFAAFQSPSTPQRQLFSCFSFFFAAFQSPSDLPATQRDTHSSLLRSSSSWQSSHILQNFPGVPCKHDTWKFHRMRVSLFARKNVLLQLPIGFCKRTNLLCRISSWYHLFSLKAHTFRLSKIQKQMLWYPCAVTGTTPSKPTYYFSFSRMLQDVFMINDALRLSPAGSSLWVLFYHYFFSSSHLWTYRIRGWWVCQALSTLSFRISSRKLT